MIIWLASYPRSGNTLLREILHNRFGAATHSIYGDTADIAKSNTLRKLTGHANDYPLTPASIELKRASDDVFFIKTHELPSVSTTLEDNVIYIARDGRDAICSYHRYLRNYGNRFYSLDDVILGQVMFGTWGDHVLAWKNVKCSNLLFLKYEDYLSNPALFVRKIEDFVGLPAGDGQVPAFDSLRESDPKFFGHGAAGTWVEQFDCEQRDLFIATHGDAMASLGYVEDSEAKPYSTNTGTAIRARLEALRVSEDALKAFAERQKETEARLASQSKQMELLSRDNKRLTTQLNAAMKEIRFVCTNSNRLNQETTLLKKELEVARAALQSLYSSHSWRITKPLRWLSTRVRP